MEEKQFSYLGYTEGLQITNLLKRVISDYISRNTNRGCVDSNAPNFDVQVINEFRRNCPEMDVALFLRLFFYINSFCLIFNPDITSFQKMTLILSDCKIEKEGELLHNCSFHFCVSPPEILCTIIAVCLYKI